ncbi:hypothetical protein DMUE_1577 [Dictyocoela muelleri]|nr:hypothetical protein DMUE_1577 [Dictyocoela muelleri]
MKRTIDILSSPLSLDPVKPKSARKRRKYVGKYIESKPIYYETDLSKLTPRQQIFRLKCQEALKTGNKELALLNCYTPDIIESSRKNNKKRRKKINYCIILLKNSSYQILNEKIYFSFKLTNFFFTWLFKLFKNTSSSNQIHLEIPIPQKLEQKNKYTTENLKDLNVLKHSYLRNFKKIETDTVSEKIKYKEKFCIMIPEYHNNDKKAIGGETFINKMYYKNKKILDNKKNIIYKKNVNQTDSKERQNWSNIFCYQKNYDEKNYLLFNNVNFDNIVRYLQKIRNNHECSMRILANALIVRINKLRQRNKSLARYISNMMYDFNMIEMREGNCFCE